MCLSIFRGQIGNLWISFTSITGKCWVHPKVSTYIVGKKTVKVSGKVNYNYHLVMKHGNWTSTNGGFPSWFHRNIPKLHGGFSSPKAQRATKHPACRRLRGLQFQGLFLVEFHPQTMELQSHGVYKGQWSVPERTARTGRNRMLPAKKMRTGNPKIIKHLMLDSTSIWLWKWVPTSTTVFFIVPKVS